MKVVIAVIFLAGAVLGQFRPQRPRPTLPPREDRCKLLQEKGCQEKWKVNNIRLCGSDKKIYTSRCAYMTAMCADANLKPARLSQCLNGQQSQFGNVTRLPRPTRGPRPTRPSLEDQCQKVQQDGCSDRMNRPARICDSTGNRYGNYCDYFKAKCASENQALKMARCLRPKPTEKPTESP